MTGGYPRAMAPVESGSFDRLYGIASRCRDAVERWTMLALSPGVAQTQEAIAAACDAQNVPDVLSLPALLSQAKFAQVHSDGRRYC